MLKAFLWANTTQNALKTKNDKIFKKMTKKKKNALCYNTFDTFQCKYIPMQMHFNV
ncbi:hypothetical protein HpBHB14_08810 [Helicobacter pylori]